MKISSSIWVKTCASLLVPQVAVVAMAHHGFLVTCSSVPTVIPTISKIEESVLQKRCNQTRLPNNSFAENNLYF